jgi:hypothetical protein
MVYAAQLKAISLILLVDDWFFLLESNQYRGD